MNIIPVKKIMVGLVALALVTGLTTACSSSGAGADGSLRLVASTNVWGDVARQIAGNQATITSIISNPDQDPHSYEASAQTQLALSRADIVIENGGGYDDFVDRMLGNVSHRPTLLNAVSISGKKKVDGELNEHVWYDFPTVQKVVAALVAALSKADRSHAGTFRANATAFDAKLADLERTEATIRAAHAGVGVAITEPVPLYMLQACGLVNRTPQAFSEAIEEGNDVSVRVLQQTLNLFSSKQVALLAYNEQTTGAVTQKVLDAAKAHGIAVVPVTETLPRGRTFETWMQANLASVQAALRSAGSGPS